MKTKQHNPSYCQRCQDFAWRRLVFRHSAARGPYMFQYRFYTRVAISKNIVNTDAVGQYEWIQVVKRYPDPSQMSMRWK